MISNSRATSRTVGFLVLALIAGALVSWLFPGKQPARRKIHRSGANADLPANSLANPAISAAPRLLSDQGIIDLLDVYTLPEDPDRPQHISGTDAHGLWNEPKEMLTQVLGKGASVLQNGLDRRRQLFNLGRLAQVVGNKDLARVYLTDSAEAGSAGAKAYLSEFSEIPLQRFKLLDQAISGGFRPAVTMKEQFEAEVIELLDKELLHPEDPQKPRGKVGVPDSNLSQMPAEELEYIIKNYGAWAKTRTELPRLSFGIGRAALWKEDYGDAKEYLEVAARLGSPGALAYLTKLPINADRFAENIDCLRAAASQGFAPAKDWLQDASKLVFDPLVFTGATKVVSALYDGRVNELLAGSIFFDDVDVQGPSQEVYRKAMLLDYMSEFADFLDSDMPSFIGDPKLLFGVIQNGKGVKGKTKLNESWAGIASNKLGAILVIQKAISGNLPAAIRAATDPEGFDASLKQRREQVRKIGQAHARTLFILKNKGNNALDRVYKSVTEFIDRY